MPFTKSASATSGVEPAYRYLRGYCLDPGFSTRIETAAINEVVYRIPFEKLEPGPRGEYIEVMDFDPASQCWYEPVDLGDERIASQHGLTPSEGNPQFHQQLVYAVAMKTIRHFEVALGRKIVWRERVLPPRRAKGVRPAGDWTHEFVRRLRIYPHAFRDANAYYDAEKKAVLFGYFAAADQSQGANYPGGLVFTCLSPDIVAHEMTHAILDSLHPRYMEDTNADVAAFHEGFADIVALLQRFTFRELVEQQLFATGGRLDRYSVLGELATQFGEALDENRGALRSMIGQWNDKGEWELRKPSPSDYANNLECHDRGAVLVATVFDAFLRIYDFRTRDLLRIATGGTGHLPKGSISPDLVRRLADEAGEIAARLLHICIRALDYCPPLDLTFGDYLRALITADIDIAPEDETGYRIVLIEAFRARGIFPDRVTTLSTESLRWGSADFTPAEKQTFAYLADCLKPHIRALVETQDRRELYLHSRKAQDVLRDLLRSPRVRDGRAGWRDLLEKLGLTTRPVSAIFETKDKLRFMRDGRLNNSYVPPIEVHSVRPAFRAGREGRQIEQVLITLTQTLRVDIGEPGQSRPMVFRGGCSLILRLDRLNEVEFVVQKNIRSYRRFCRQRDYFLGDSEGGLSALSMYDHDERAWRLSFRHLHGGSAYGGETLS